MTPVTAPDISATALVRRFGVGGARIFARIWFPLAYLLLTGLGAALWIQPGDPGSDGLRAGAMLLVVLAALLLAGMWLRYRKSIERLEGDSIEDRSAAADSPGSS
jgi:hypothetical protein